MVRICLYLIAAVVVVIGTTSLALPPPEGPKLNDFKDVLATAIRLESAEMTPQRRQQVAEKRNDLLYSLAREVKSKHCEDYFQSIQRTTEEFKIKAYQYIEEESKQNKGWFGFMKFGGPMKSMKDMGRNEAFLGTLSERYESQVKTGIVKQLDVDCDMVKFQVRSLHNVMFVLQTDIKYLLMEQQQILNKAIYEQLKADRFVSKVNFYEIDELTNGQREILLNFFSDRVDDTVVTVGQAVDHFYNPGQYIIGRLMDSCKSVLEFEEPWGDLKEGYDQVCQHSNADPKGHLFEKDYRFDKFDSVFKFCREFDEAL